MSKILFIIPPVQGMYGKPSTPHTGISYLASYIRERGHIPEVLDLRVEEMDIAGIKQKINLFKPDFIGVTAVTLDYHKTYEFINMLSQGHHKVIYGGPHVSSFREKIFEQCNPYAAVYGEGEETLAELMENKPLEEIKGIIYKNSLGEIIANPARGGIEPLDTLPFPAFELSKLDLYAERKIPLITSRECPHKCIYCNVKVVMGNGFRKRSPENVIHEIEYWYSKGYREFAIGDDTFSSDIGRAIDICDLIIQRKLDISWELRTGIRVDRVNEELLRKIKDAGCRFIAYGIESIDDDVLRNAKKGISFSQINAALELTERVGIPFSGFFIIGLPGDNLQKFNQLFKFAKERHFNEVRFYHLTPYPGTELFEWVKANRAFAVLPEVYLNSYSILNNNPVFFTNDFPIKDRIRAHDMGEALMATLLLKKTFGKSLGSVLGVLCKNNRLRKNILKTGFRYTSLARRLQKLKR